MHSQKIPQDVDTDGDGYGDNGDAFPYDASEWRDFDGDGVGDNADAFPHDSTETTDTDGDGYGDNGDAFPYDASEWRDFDGDGVGDNADAFHTIPQRRQIQMVTALAITAIPSQLIRLSGKMQTAME